MPANISSPSLWSQAIIDKFNDDIRRVAGISKALMGTPYPTNMPVASPEERLHMKMNPELEAYFVAIALEHGTHPEPTFGLARNRLANDLTIVMSEHPGTPLIMKSVRRNYAELGGKAKEADSNWFYTKIADAYLDWLYSQPESMALLEGALAKLKSSPDKFVSGRDVYGLKAINPFEKYQR